MDDQEPRTDEALTEDQDMDAEGEYNDEEYDEDGLFDEDDEEEEDPEVVAKRLGDALWADISKAYAQRASEPAPAPATPSPSSGEEHDDDDEDFVNVIQTVLGLASSNAALNNVLSSTMLPGAENQSLLQILTGTAETKDISPNLAETLSNLVQSIAEGDLFARAE